VNPFPLGFNCPFDLPFNAMGAECHCHLRGLMIVVHHVIDWLEAIGANQIVFNNHLDFGHH
jgi:hypothetical protein